MKEHTIPFRSISCVVLAVALTGADAPDTVAAKVRRGLEQFFGGNFSDAKTSFDEAGEQQPENDVIKFDKGCAAFATGDVDDARSLLRAASLAKDSAIAIKAHYNLGCLEAEQAKAKLGNDPAAAEGGAREESMQLLLTSVRHYRDALQLSPDHKGARHNIELIRLFMKHIQSQWAERDKQKNRDEKDLVQFVLMLEANEYQINGETKTLRNEDDAPQRRQILRKIAEAQRELQEEIPPLRHKIEQAFAASQQQGGASGSAPQTAPDERAQEMLDTTLEMADEIDSQMQNAAEAIVSANFAAATKSQSEVINMLNQLYMIAAPYESLLQRSLATQRQVAPEEEASGDAKADGDKEQTSDATSVEEPVDDGAPDFETLRETQTRISEWTQILPLKAEAVVPEVQKQLDAIQSAETTTDAPDADKEIRVNIQPDDEPQDKGVEEVSNASRDDSAAAGELSPEEKQQAQQREQLQGLLESLQLAIQLAPDAVEHSDTAIEHLKGEDLENAQPEQNETLRILDEIAAPLKKQDQEHQPQDEGDDQNEQNGKQEDQKQPEKNDQGEDKDQQQQEKQQQQQAESALRQARERERDYRKMLKDQLRAFGRNVPVERDW